ncbi:uncharacterized protein LOC144037574 [Vanacampus margaritifer]
MWVHLFCLLACSSLGDSCARVTHGFISMCSKMATARHERLDKTADDQHGAAGAGWTPSGGSVHQELATGIQLIWVLFCLAEDEPQTRRETRAKVEIKKLAASNSSSNPASQAPSISKNNYESVESQAVGGK